MTWAPLCTAMATFHPRTCLGDTEAGDCDDRAMIRFPDSEASGTNAWRWNEFFLSARRAVTSPSVISKPPDWLFQAVSYSPGNEDGGGGVLPARGCCVTFLLRLSGLQSPYSENGGGGELDKKRLLQSPLSELASCWAPTMCQAPC